MEQQRDKYICLGDYERSEERISSINGQYNRYYRTRVGNTNLKNAQNQVWKILSRYILRITKTLKSTISRNLKMYVQGL